MYTCIFIPYSPSYKPLWHLDTSSHGFFQCVEPHGFTKQLCLRRLPYTLKKVRFNLSTKKHGSISQSFPFSPFVFFSGALTVLCSRPHLCSCLRWIKLEKMQGPLILSFRLIVRLTIAALPWAHGSGLGKPSWLWVPKSRGDRISHVQLTKVTKVIYIYM